MGVVYQSFQLLPMDFSDNFHPCRSRERAMELLELVELEEHANKLPAYVSSGQQQVAIANNPQILVADEPTSSLDSITAEVLGKIEQKRLDHHRIADHGAVSR